MDDDRNTQREIAQDETNKQIMLSLGRLEGQMESVVRLGDKLTTIADNHDKRIAQNTNDLSGIKIKIGLASAFIGAVFASTVQWFWYKLFR